MHDYIYQFNKKDYIKGQQKATECILCEILKTDPCIPCLEIFQSEFIMCSVNLYPYNNGHVLVFPKRHITDYRELSDKEHIQINYFTSQLITALFELYKPTGFNIGYNLGQFSGASINHLHQHIIPRYPNELGMIDIIGGAKVIIENPETTQKSLITYLKDKNDSFTYAITLPELI